MCTNVSNHQRAPSPFFVGEDRAIVRFARKWTLTSKMSGIIWYKAIRSSANHNLIHEEILRTKQQCEWSRQPSRNAAAGGMRISVFPHPEPKMFRQTAFFSFSNFFPLIPLVRGKKKRHFWGGRIVSSPGGPCTTLNTSIRFVQAFGRSFSFSLCTLPDKSSSSFVNLCKYLINFFHRF